MVREIVLFLEQALSMVGDNRYLQAAIAVVLGLVLAKVVDVVITLAARWTRKTKTDLDDMIVDAIHRPVAVTMVLIGLGAATLLLKIEGTALVITVGILRTILIIVWVQFLMKFARFVCRIVAGRPGERGLIQHATLPLFDNLILLGTIGLGTYLILHVWDVDISAWLASAGIIGLALSFAAKDSLANLFGGLFIIADSPYRVGDYVVLDSGERGRVTHIGLRSTRLLTRDDVEVTIPNAVMGNSKIVNETGGPHDKYRIRVPVTVCYGEDLDRVEETLLQIVGTMQHVCKDPEARVRFRSFDNFGIKVELLCWVAAPVYRGLVTDQLIKDIHKTFNDKGITFPYPRQELYLHSTGRPAAE